VSALSSPELEGKSPSRPCELSQKKRKKGNSPRCIPPYENGRKVSWGTTCFAKKEKKKGKEGSRWTEPRPVTWLYDERKSWEVNPNLTFEQGRKRGRKGGKGLDHFPRRVTLVRAKKGKKEKLPPPLSRRRQITRTKSIFSISPALKRKRRRKKKKRIRCRVDHL